MLSRAANIQRHADIYNKILEGKRSRTIAFELGMTASGVYSRLKTMVENGSIHIVSTPVLKRRFGTDAGFSSTYKLYAVGPSAAKVAAEKRLWDQWAQLISTTVRST